MQTLYERGAGGCKGKDEQRPETRGMSEADQDSQQLALAGWSQEAAEARRESTEDRRMEQEELQTFMEAYYKCACRKLQHNDRV